MLTQDLTRVDTAVKIYEVNDCMIDLSLREVVYGFEAINPRKEVFDTLVYLIENRDHSVSIEEFRESLWGDSDASEFEIVHAVNRARRVILDDEPHNIIRYDSASSSYRFLGDVIEMEII
ncbi:MAG: DNA-binding response OmpR family regulator [Flavobacteriales bacterium]|jgi:DNA-binding response OmpR family regulator